jgi:hypothetical protein
MKEMEKEDEVTKAQKQKLRALEAYRRLTK